MNYCDMKGLVWPLLFCVFVICILPVLLVDNASIVSKVLYLVILGLYQNDTKTISRDRSKENF